MKRFSRWKHDVQMNSINFFGLFVSQRPFCFCLGLKCCFPPRWNVALPRDVQRGVQWPKKSVVFFTAHKQESWCGFRWFLGRPDLLNSDFYIISLPEGLETWQFWPVWLVTLHVDIKKISDDALRRFSWLWKQRCYKKKGLISSSSADCLLSPQHQRHSQISVLHIQ